MDIKRWLRYLRRRYLMYRYPNLIIEHGAVIFGRFDVRGQGSITIERGCRLIDVSLHVQGALHIGANGFLNGTSIVCMNSVIIGNDCLLSDAYITDTDFHNIEPELRHAPPSVKVVRPITIGRNVWIGDRGVVLKGSRIGDDAVVGSNAVVRGSIPPRSVCLGNPAQVVKQL
ncbi:MAG TPA: acyltransferase [Sulfuriferula sp.]|nr:acyltransferase [Sulfuriferula sp.]